MHFWIDIDNSNDVPLIKALIVELKERGHAVTVTAQNSKEIKKTLEENNLNAKVIGMIFSIFGLFKEQLQLLRTAFLLDYLKQRKVDVAFSTGSKPMLYACIDQVLPIITLVKDKKYKPNEYSLALEKSFFIVSDSLHDQELIEKGFDLNKIAKYNEKLFLNQDLKLTKDLANKIELLGEHIPGGAIA